MKRNGRSRPVDGPVLPSPDERDRQHPDLFRRCPRPILGDNHYLLLFIVFLVFFSFSFFRPSLTSLLAVATTEGREEEPPLPQSQATLSLSLSPPSFLPSAHALPYKPERKRQRLGEGDGRGGKAVRSFVGRWVPPRSSSAQPTDRRCCLHIHIKEGEGESSEVKRPRWAGAGGKGGRKKVEKGQKKEKVGGGGPSYSSSCSIYTVLSPLLGSPRVV